MVRLPALTPLRLRVVGEVSSKTHFKGDKVAIVLAEALRLSDTLVIPAGTRGVAEVIHSAKGGMGGKAGELLVAARTLDLSPTFRSRCVRSGWRRSQARIMRDWPRGCRWLAGSPGAWSRWR